MDRKESGLSLAEGAGCQLFHYVCDPSPPVLAGGGAVLAEPALVHGPAEGDSPRQWGGARGGKGWVLVVQSGALILSSWGGGLPDRGNCELQLKMVRGVPGTENRL